MSGAQRTPFGALSSIFGLDGQEVEEGTNLLSTYTEMAEVIGNVTGAGYALSLAKVEEIIEDGGYDYDLSMERLTDYAQTSTDDICYILAAYSASLQQQNTSEIDMVAKLDAVIAEMFPVTYEEKELEQAIPLTYTTYRPVTVTAVTELKLIGTFNGVSQ